MPLTRRLGLLVGGTILFWIALTYTGSLFLEDPVWLFSTTAMALCLVPAAATLIWFSRVAHDSPQRQLTAVLGGTGIRLAVVLGAGMGLTVGFPDVFPKAFLFWLLVYYLFTLFLEVKLVLPPKEQAKGDV